MLKNEQMTFTIEPALRMAFTEAASRNNQVTDQVLQEFVRRYVDETRELATRPAITSEERSRRESAVRAARASVILEGFKPSKDEEDRAQRFINGEIGLTDYIGSREQAHDSQTQAR